MKSSTISAAILSSVALAAPVAQQANPQNQPAQPLSTNAQAQQETKDGKQFFGGMYGMGMMNPYMYMNPYAMGMF